MYAPGQVGREGEESNGGKVAKDGEKLGTQHMALRDMVVQTLREQIISGKRKPGERLVEESLAEELGVSRHPIRLAIHVLATQGYATIIPRRGARVAELSHEEVEHIFQVRIALESLAARLACRNASPANMQNLMEIIDAADDLVARNPNSRRLGELNERFHTAVLELAGNPILAEIMGALSSRMLWIFRTTLGEQRRVMTDSRRQLVEAISAHDEDLAARLAADHIQYALERYRAAVRGTNGDGP
ncbi:MAG: GntR family transcriptional regulator [Ilumatobacteraceae bacterium]